MKQVKQLNELKMGSLNTASRIWAIGMASSYLVPGPGVIREGGILVWWVRVRERRWLRVHTREWLVGL